MANEAPHFALIAGELSGDILGAALIRALRQRYPQARFSGLTGPRMLAEGCESVGSIEALSLMGIAEVLPAIPRLMRLRAALVERYARERPEVLIGIDAPDFNLGLERRLRERGLKTVHMVSPSVWAWREGRVHGIAKSVDLMLCLFPFEPAFYAKHSVRAAYVGHPLADQLDDTLSPAAGRAALGLPERPTLAVLPGSRGGEVGRLAVPYAQAAARLAVEFPDLQFVTPVAKPSLRPLMEAALREHAPGLRWTLLDGQSRHAMQAADAVLLASGTATLECLLLGRAMVAGYRVAPFTAWLLRRLVKIHHASLPNLLCERPVVTECLQEDCTPENLVAALRPLLVDPAARNAQTAAFSAVRQELKRDAGMLAAQAISDLLGN
ncbi:MAG: lipid-A-disaccharide synthase [Stagnimonas sp.]|nr:lipid-A-disaccharide synthase [Stagnimonas sp.]